MLSEAPFDEGPSLGPLRRERLLWSLAVLLESACLGYELDLILSSTDLLTGIFIYVLTYYEEKRLSSLRCKLNKCKSK